MRYLVTGGAGFIGSHLVDELIKQGNEVIIIDNLSTGKKENINKEAKFYNLDIRNFDSIKPLFKDVDYVFHLAAQARIPPSISDPRETMDINVNGTTNVLLASRYCGVKKVIYSASSSAYGDQEKLPLHEEMLPMPKNPYAISKVIGEQLCKMFYELYGLKTLSLRYFNVHGPRQPEDRVASSYATVIGIFLKQKKENLKLTIIGDGEQKRDFTYVSDVVNANILAAKSNVGKGEVINIGSGKSYSINEVASIILGTKNIKNFVKYLLPRQAEVQATLADITKAKILLGWEPKVMLKEGIKLTELHSK